MADSTVATAPAAPDRRSILSAVRGSIAPAPVPLPYQFALAAVAVAMVLLPLVYLSLVSGVAYATWWHAVNDLSWLSGKGSARGRLFVYATPLVGGLVTVFFMIKPLLARHAPKQTAMVLDRRKEPFLYDFVDRLCRTVGAPPPVRIEVDCQVNASAQRVGFADSGGLVLTIGLPLVAGLDLRQMTGVLAHEFGHFAQGAGMRLSGLIRRVNLWFARVVYERDAWDARLEKAGGEGGSGGIIMLVARLLVWLSRRVLQLLMIVGHVLSCALMRQMEHDADRYEAMLAGSDTFAATARRLRVLAGTWKDGRLAADLPGFVVARAGSLPPEVASGIEGSVDEGKTGWFDTHPCDRERIERTARLRSPGLFRLDAPATALFRDFGALAREASLQHYRDIAGDGVREDHLVPNEALLEAVGDREEAQEVFARLTQGLVDIDHLVFPAPAGAARAAVRDARARFEAELPRAREAFRRLEKASERAMAAAMAGELLAAGLQPDAKAFLLPVATAEGVRRSAARAASEAEEARSALSAWDDALSARLATATANPDLRDCTAALAALQKGQPCLEALRLHLAALSALLGNVGDDVPPKLQQAIKAAAERTQGTLAGLAGALGQAAYPFEHAGEAVTLARHVLPVPPQPDSLESVFGGAREALERYVAVYVRVLGTLAPAVEAAEVEAGCVLQLVGGHSSVSSEWRRSSVTGSRAA
jgi:Zn-dependent protease with chaperone function